MRGGFVVENCPLETALTTPTTILVIVGIEMGNAESMKYELEMCSSLPRIESTVCSCAVWAI